MYNWYILGPHKRRVSYGTCFIWGMGVTPCKFIPHRRTKSMKLGKVHAWHGKMLRCCAVNL